MTYTLGIDSSTQSVKALVYEVETGRVVTTVAVNFGKDLPAFGCPDGFLPNEDQLVRQADPRLWVAALEKVLQKLADSFDTSKIDAIGGDGQQHGSVYLGAGWSEALASLSDAADGRTLVERLDGAFSRLVAPIWMDSSTHAEVAALDARFGETLRLRTGSPAIERFTGPQIMKFAKEDPSAFAAVFGAKVETLDVPDSAALGGAILASRLLG